MSSQHFLENEKYTYSVAKLAIVVQSVLTFGICISLLSMMNGSRSCDAWLSAFLTLDIIFIICHLSYRGMYRGKKVVLKKNEKMILLGHIITSVLALLYTLMYVRGIKGDVLKQTIATALSLWGSSLVLGIVFFFKKYRSHIQ